MGRTDGMCPRCGINPKPVGGKRLRQYCWSCQIQGADLVYQALKEQPCVDCGLVDPEIIEFDHVPERGNRNGSLGQKVASGIVPFALEAIKTDPVCPNCHVRRTKRRKQNPGMEARYR